MKKLGIWALSAVLLLGNVPAVYAETVETVQVEGTGQTTVCTDIRGTKYEEAVSALIEKGVVGGYQDGTFRPGNSVTRGEAAKMLVLAKDLTLDPEPAVTESGNGTKVVTQDVKAGFSDVNGHWAKEYVEIAAENGYINGYQNGKFMPNASITYNEAAKLMVVALGIPEEELKGTWPNNYRNKADAYGITEGLPGKSFGSQPANRGDFALMLYRTVYTKLTENENLNDPKDSGTEPISLSLVQAIEEITTSGSGYETAVLNKKINEESATLTAQQISNLKEMGQGKTYSTMELERAKVYLREIAPIQYEAELNALEYNAVSAYMNVVKMENTVRIARENLAAKQTILSNAQKKYKVGMAAKMDVTTAESNVKSASISVEQAESGLASLRMVFNIAMGYDVMRDVTFTDKLKKMDSPTMNLASDIEAGKEKELTAYQLRYMVQEAEWEMKSTKAVYPKNCATYRLAETKLIQAQENYDTAMKGIEMTIRSNYRAITNGQTSIASAQNALDLAKETYRVALVGYNAGTSTMSDLQQAQLNVSSCETNLESAIADYNLAIYDYKYAVGAGKYTATASK